MGKKKQKTTSKSDEIVAAKPENKVYALGLAMRVLATETGYMNLRLGDGVRLLTGLIERGHYFFAIKDGEIVGFLGWALTDKARGEAWLKGEAELTHEDCLSGDSIIINVWRAASPEAQKFMLEHMRETQADKVMVYAKRHYSDGRVRPVRLPLSA